MKKFKFLEHTADAKFQAFGKDMDEAFINAAFAMFSIITDETIKGKIKKDIKVEGRDMKSLLYNFLEELLFLKDSDNIFPGKFKMLKISNEYGKFKLVTEFYADEAENYETNGDIKAVTYNEMDIIEEKDKAIVQVVVDL